MKVYYRLFPGSFFCFDTACQRPVNGYYSILKISPVSMMLQDSLDFILEKPSGKVIGRNCQEKSSGEIIRRSHREKFLGEIFRRNHQEKSLGEVIRGNHREKFLGEVIRRSHQEKFLGEIIRRNFWEKSSEEIIRSNYEEQLLENLFRSFILELFMEKIYFISQIAFVSFYFEGKITSFWSFLWKKSILYPKQPSFHSILREESLHFGDVYKK